jgi:hypothetical protein
LRPLDIALSHLTISWLVATSQAVIDGLSEIQDGGPVGDIVDNWEDEPAGDQLNLLEDVGLNYEQLCQLISTIAPKP